LKLICQIFHFAYKNQQNFSIFRCVETLEIHQFFSRVARTFSYTQAWVPEGGNQFENFRKKAVFLVSSGKKRISPLLPPIPRKMFGKIHQWPLPGKDFSDAHAHKHVTLHHFCKKLCCVTPYGNTVE